MIRVRRNVSRLNGLRFAIILAFLVPFVLRAQNAPGGPASHTGYRVVGRYPVGGEGGWDYISIDSDARRLYVSHGAQLEVLDADSGKIVGKIADTPGVHGAAIAPEFHRGFTSNGRDKSLTIFDTKTLATIGKVPLESGTDFILYDSFSKRVFPINEKITVIDAGSGKVAGTVDLGGDPEEAVSDGKGTVYVNLADKEAVAVVDPKTLTVTKTYPIEHCTSPHSLSFDAVNQRLFVGCKDGFAALDATTGKVVGRSLMCSGVDAGGFDSDNKWIFESCGEGVISVIRETTPDYYELIETVPTQLFARTMVFDPKTKNIYLLTAEFETALNTDSAKSPQRKMRPRSFTVLVVGR
jgi:DNA-binding beta-propeller fold protein YncE